MMEYIVLYNPHNEKYLLFDYDEDKIPYAPNYGTPISQGETAQSCIDNGCKMWGINPAAVIS